MPALIKRRPAQSWLVVPFALLVGVLLSATAIMTATALSANPLAANPDPDQPASYFDDDTAACDGFFSPRQVRLVFTSGGSWPEPPRACATLPDDFACPQLLACANAMPAFCAVLPTNQGECYGTVAGLFGAAASSQC
jgi:hypothetical protein